MNNRTTASPLRLAVPLFALLAAALAPREALAQFRLSGLAGVEHIGGNGVSSTMVQYRAEATVAFIPWFHGGAYVQGLSAFSGNAGTGYGIGGLATFRPSLPGTSIDPMGYASIGYQRAPAGAVFASNATVELGGGLAWHVLPIVDLELRGGYVGLLGSDGMNGFSVAAGLSLHP